MKNLSLWTSGIAIALATAAYANDDLIAQMENSKQWAIQTGDYKNQRYSELDQINADNVGDLQVAWTFSTGVLRGHEGSPLVIGDMMYVHTPFPNIVYALDLANEGKIVWKYEPKQDPDVIPVMCCDAVNRGVAYVDGKIFLHQADTKVVALDAKSGDVVWEVQNGDPAIGETNTATVLPIKDKVILLVVVQPRLRIQPSNGSNNSSRGGITKVIMAVVETEAGAPVDSTGGKTVRDLLLVEDLPV